MAFLNDFRSLCTASGFKNISVEPHQTITRRSALLFFFKVANVFSKLLGQVELILPLLDVGAVQILHVVLIEAAFMGLMVFRNFWTWRGLWASPTRRRLKQPCTRRPGNIPAAEDDVVEIGERKRTL